MLAETTIETAVGTGLAVACTTLNPAAAAIYLGTSTLTDNVINIIGNQTGVVESRSAKIGLAIAGFFAGQAIGIGIASALGFSIPFTAAILLTVGTLGTLSLLFVSYTLIHSYFTGTLDKTLGEWEKIADNLFGQAGL